MHKMIIVGGQKYELQITARKIINNGGTSVYMDREETDELFSAIDEYLRCAIDAIDYASKQRSYEASFERDENVRDGMIDTATEWKDLSNGLYMFLNG